MEGPASSAPPKPDRPPWDALRSWVLRHGLAVIAVVWMASTLVTGPVNPAAASPRWHWKVGPIYLGRPIVTSGDSPHYLVVVNSLVEDFDLDLGNNYRQVEAWDWDAGTRVRGTPFGLGHTDIDQKGRALGIHPPFRPILLAALLWPFRGTEWVESLSIWITMLGVLAAFSLFRKTPLHQTRWPLALAFCTPIWFYSRDLWGESWMAAAWMLLLIGDNPWVLGLAAFGGTLVKYPFAVVPLTLAALAFRRGDRRRSLLLAGTTVSALILAFLFTQWVFRDVDHFSLFHQGTRHLPGEAPFQLSPLSPLRGAAGLLLDPRRGLLPFFPFLLWGLPELRKGGDRYLPAVAFFLLHASYAGWHGGSGFSARFLVPALPVLVWAVAQRKPRGAVFNCALAYSLFWGVLAGFLPVAVLDRSPLETARFLFGESVGFLGSLF